MISKRSTQLGYLIFCLVTAGIMTGYSPGAFTQDIPENILERLIEQLEEDENTDPVQLTEFIQELAENPLNINESSKEELLSLPFLDAIAVNRILDYRNKIGRFESTAELLNIPELDHELIEILIPFISAETVNARTGRKFVNPDKWMQNMKVDIMTRYQQTLQAREGFRRLPDEGGYTGSPGKFYQRFRVQTDRISLNLTQEKDPGEPFGMPASMDFQSWHLAYKSDGFFREFITGDYSVAFGQGLILWNGSSFGKSRNVDTAPVRSSRGFRPFTSSQETNAFRGAALSAGKRIMLSTFYSSRFRTSTTADSLLIRLPQSSGLHRTVNEIERKNNVKQTTLGGRLQYNSKKGRAGINVIFNNFDKPVAPGNRMHQKFDFSGTSQTAFSSDYEFVQGSLLFFGEGAMTDNGGLGFLNGIRYKPSSGTSVVLTHRNYGKRFQPLFGSAFGEQSGAPQNEKGFYIGLKQRIRPKVTLSGYFDQFRFPGPRFVTTNPSGGHEWLFQSEFSLSPEVQIYILARSSSSEAQYETADFAGRTVKVTGLQKRDEYRFNFSFKPEKNIRLQSRFELIRSREADGSLSNGYLLYQDIRLVPSPKIRIDARITLFDTDGFQSRVFQFESDLLYVFSNKALFDRGQRVYMVVKYDITNNIELWGKWSTTLFENRNTISSGLNEIKGTRQSDIGVQIRMQF